MGIFREDGVEGPIRRAGDGLQTGKGKLLHRTDATAAGSGGGKICRGLSIRGTSAPAMSGVAGRGARFGTAAMVSESIRQVDKGGAALDDSRSKGRGNSQGSGGRTGTETLTVYPATHDGGRTAASAAKNHAAGRALAQLGE